MKKVLGIAVVCCVIGLLIAPASARDALVKVGGAVYFGDDPLYGGAIAVDIQTPLLEERLYVSPFADVYAFGGDSNSSVKVGAGGVSVLYKAEAGEGVHIYGGVGGGGGQVRFQSESKTGGAIAALLGLQYAAHEKVSVFAQGKFLAMLTDEITVGTIQMGNRATLDAPKKFTIQVGVAINVGQ